MHPREAVQHVVLALLKAADGELKDDATAMCVDWHGGPPRERRPTPARTSELSRAVAGVSTRSLSTRDPSGGAEAGGRADRAGSSSQLARRDAHRPDHIRQREREEQRANGGPHLLAVERGALRDGLGDHVADLAPPALQSCRADLSRRCHGVLLIVVPEEVLPRGARVARGGGAPLFGEIAQGTLELGVHQQLEVQRLERLRVGLDVERAMQVVDDPVPRCLRPALDLGMKELGHAQEVDERLPLRAAQRVRLDRGQVGLWLRIDGQKAGVSPGEQPDVDAEKREGVVVGFELAGSRSLDRGDATD